MKKLFLLVTGVLITRMAAAGTLYSDRLDNAASTALGQMQNRSGEFIAGSGWKATAGNSQLRITLPAPLPPAGSLLVDVRNFDPVRQNIDVKQQIINLYSQENGSKAIFETSGSWINIRTGTGYSVGEGVAGFKMLAAPRGIDTRDEVRIMEDATWELGKTYEFRITWDQASASVYLDGSKCFTLPFAGQVEMFRYIFLGTDNVYVAQPGVIYSNLRILGASDTAEVPGSAHEVMQPLQARLLPNYPNPFNPETTLTFEVLERGLITLQICNLFGQTVATLVDEERVPGTYQVVWDGRDQQGRPAAGGAYFSRLRTASGQSTRRMTLLK